MSRRESGSHPDAWDDPYGLGSVIGNEAEDNTTVEPNAYGVNGSAIPVPQLIMDAAMTARYHGGGSASVIPEVHQDRETPPLQQFNEQEQIMHPPSDALPQAIMDEGRQEDMEKAAKIAILADEPRVLGMRALGETDDLHHDLERSNTTSRRQQNMSETAVVRDRDDSSEETPPSVIEVPPDGQNMAAAALSDDVSEETPPSVSEGSAEGQDIGGAALSDDSSEEFPPSSIEVRTEGQSVAAAALSAFSALSDDELDSISHSLPLAMAYLVQESRSVSAADASDESFIEQISELLLSFRQRRFEENLDQASSLNPNASSRTDTMPPQVGINDPSQRSETSPRMRRSFSVQSFVRDRREPPGSFLHENLGREEGADIQINTQINDDNAWLRERLAASVASQRNPFALDPEEVISDSDIQSPASAPTGSALSIDASDLEFQDPRVALGLEDESVEDVSNLRYSTGRMPPRVPVTEFDDPLGEAVEVRACSAQPSSADDDSEHQLVATGALRMVGPGGTRDSGTVVVGDDDNPGEATYWENMAGPVTAQTVGDDLGTSIRQLQAAVTELQQNRTILEAEVQHAVAEEEDAALSFLETYRDGMLVVCLSVGVGFVLGAKMSRS